MADGAVSAVKIATGAITETKISDGAISTPKLAAGSITAEKVQAGAIGADQIAAKAITTEKLVVGVGSNLLAEPDFSAGLVGWTSSPGFTASTTQFGPENDTATIIHVAPIVNDQGIFNMDWQYRRVVPGASYRYEMLIRRISEADNGNIRLRALEREGLETGSNSWPWLVSTNAADLPRWHWRTITGTRTVPSNINFMSVELNAQNAVGAEFQIAFVSMRQMSTGELIVDGAITTNKIKAGAITSSELAL